MTPTPKTTVPVEHIGKKNDEEQKLLKVVFKRNPAVGLQLTVQSDFDWSMFRDPRNQTTNISGVACYVPKSEQFPNVSGYFWRANGYETLFYGNTANLIILLAKDIKNGVTFNLGMFPISPETLEAWKITMEKQMLAIYENYCKSIEYEVEITVRTLSKIKSN